MAEKQKSGDLPDSREKVRRLKGIEPTLKLLENLGLIASESQNLGRTQPSRQGRLSRGRENSAPSLGCPKNGPGLLKKWASEPNRSLGCGVDLS